MKSAKIEKKPQKKRGGERVRVRFPKRVTNLVSSPYLISGVSAHRPNPKHIEKKPG